MNNLLPQVMLALAISLTTSIIHAATILDIQYGNSGTTAVQSGFDLTGIGTASFAPVTSGFTTSTIGVTTTGQAVIDRGVSFSGTYANFYSAFLYNTLGISFTGLDPSTTYQIAFQGFDASTGSSSFSYTLTDSTVGGTGNSGTVTYYEAGDPSHSLGVTAGVEYPAVIEFTSDASGNASFANNGASRINGFELTSLASAPEPSTWTMLVVGMGALGFAVRRRRHRFL